MKHRHPVRYLKAIHESGHAIIAAVLGLPIVHVTIQPDREGREGHLQPGASDDYESHLLMNVAGDCAVFLHKPDGLRQLNRGLPNRSTGGVKLRDIADDHQQFDAMHKLMQPDPLAVTDDDAAGAKRKANARAMSILAGRWPAVLRLADELYTHRTVTGERVVEIVAGVDDDVRRAALMLMALQATAVATAN